MHKLYLQVNGECINMDNEIDKYQKFLLDSISLEPCYLSGEKIDSYISDDERRRVIERRCDDERRRVAERRRVGNNQPIDYNDPADKAYIIWDHKSVIIAQDHDITLTKYRLSLSGRCIKSVWTIKERKEDSVKAVTLKEQTPEPEQPAARTAKRVAGKPPITWQNSEPSYIIELNFDKKIDAVKISFINDLADDVVIPISYIDADKEAYARKKAKENYESMSQRANVRCAPGASLVNVYFNPCCDEYDHSEITLYVAEETKTSYDRSGYSHEIGVAWSELTHRSVDKGDKFKSFDGLAYGVYSIVLQQYDKSGKMIFETPHIKFTIDPPYYGGRTVNVIQ